jgi:hypothetical protein
MGGGFPENFSVANHHCICPDDSRRGKASLNRKSLLARQTRNQDFWRFANQNRLIYMARNHLEIGQKQLQQLLPSWR